MKKLIMGLAVVAAATAVQAGSIKWSTGAMNLSDGTAPTAIKQMTAYLFMVESSVYDTYKGYTDGAKLSEDLYKAYGSKLDDANLSKQAAKNGNTDLQIKDGTSAKDYPNGTYYAVVLISDDVNTGNWMGNIASVEVESSSGVSRGSLGLQILGDGASTTNKTGWYAVSVPEPTSGLLLVLGVAGLALKRKRA